MFKTLDSIIGFVGSGAIVAAIVGIANHGTGGEWGHGRLDYPTHPTPVATSVVSIVSTRAAAGERFGRDEFLATLVAHGHVINHGREQYRMFCAACHGETDLGDDSPSNLFNNRWVHGGRPSDIERIIREGYLPTGMPAWDGMIPDEDIEAMVAFILAGQNDS